MFSVRCDTARIDQYDGSNFKAIVAENQSKTWAWSRKAVVTTDDGNVYLVTKNPFHRLADFFLKRYGTDSTYLFSSVFERKKVRPFTEKSGDAYLLRVVGRGLRVEQKTLQKIEEDGNQWLEGKKDLSRDEAIRFLRTLTIRHDDSIVRKAVCAVSKILGNKGGEKLPGVQPSKAHSWDLQHFLFFDRQMNDKAEWLNEKKATLEKEGISGDELNNCMYWLEALQYSDIQNKSCGDTFVRQYSDAALVAVKENKDIKALEILIGKRLITVSMREKSNGLEHFYIRLHLDQ